MMLPKPLLPARRVAAWLLALLTLGMGGAALADPTLAPFSGAAPGAPPSSWHVVDYFHGRKPLTRFDIVALDGQPVLRVETDRSYATLLHPLPPAPPAAGTRLRWRWRLDRPLLDTDLQRKSGDDGPLKVCAMFDLPLDKLGFFERNKVRAMRATSDDPLPSATLCYVWDHALPVGTVLRNAFTGTVRIVVVNSGEQRLGQWIAQEHDLDADFLRAFGPDVSSVPPLVGIAVIADADNTQGHSLGYVGDISLGP